MRFRLAVIGMEAFVTSLYCFSKVFAGMGNHPALRAPLLSRFTAEEGSLNQHSLLRNALTSLMSIWKGWKMGASEGCEEVRNFPGGVSC